MSADRLDNITAVLRINRKRYKSLGEAESTREGSGTQWGPVAKSKVTSPLSFN